MRRICRPACRSLRADERKTKQVLLNLVTNAAKFTPRGGHIEIAGEYDDETGLTLTVIDTGIGIAPDDIGRVLEPFVQVDSSLSRQHQGTGLGLPLVKAIMELHGGSLTLESTVGVGTRVTRSTSRSRAPCSTRCASRSARPDAPSVPPARVAAERFGGDDPAHDRAGEAVGRRAAEPRQAIGVDRVAAPGRKGKDRVAVEGRMCRADCAREPVLRHHRKAPAAVLVERQVGRDEGDRRVGAGAHGPQAEKSSGSSGVSGTGGCGGISPGKASSAAQSRPLSGRTTEPAQLTTTIAPIVPPSAQTSEAPPTPPLSCPALAPSPAPALPSANSAAGARRGDTAEPAIGRRVLPSAAAGKGEVEDDRRRHDRHAHVAHLQSRAPFAARHSMTPPAASSPKAEPPDSTTASTRSTSVPGPSNSVSRLPGAPPRTSTAATAGASASTTVVPLIAGAILGLADEHARHVGDQIARARCGHAPSPWHDSSLLRMRR